MTAGAALTQHFDIKSTVIYTFKHVRLKLKDFIPQPLMKTWC